MTATLASGAPRPEQTFPVLTAPQMERLAARGRVRAVGDGEVLFEAGDEIMPFFVVREGEIEIIRPDGQETVVVRYGPGQFTGETNGPINASRAGREWAHRRGP